MKKYLLLGYLGWLSLGQAVACDSFPPVNDIVTKEHRGQMTLETREGKFAEFVIKLPVT